MTNLPVFPGADTVLKAARPSATIFGMLDMHIDDARVLARDTANRLDCSWHKHPTDETQVALRRYADAWKTLADQLQDCQERLLELRG